MQQMQGRSTRPQGVLLHSTSLLTAPPAVPRATAQQRCDMPMAMAREVQPLNVVEDLTEALTSAADNRIVCIMFKMPNCRMCRAIEPKFARLASKQDQHRFYSVDWLSAKEVLKHCAIGHVPSAQGYRSGEMVHAQVHTRLHKTGRMPCRCTPPAHLHRCSPLQTSQNLRKP